MITGTARPSALFAMKFRRALCLVASLAASAAYAMASPPPPALLHPLKLDDAVAYAVEHSPALHRAQEQIRAEEGVLVEARAARLPALLASASATRVEDALLESPLYTDRTWTVDVQVRQVLYAGGSLQAQQRSQREQLEAARLTYTAAVNDTLLTVHRQFHDVLLYRELITVREEALSVLESELTNARNRRAAGTGSDFEVLRAEVAVANARPALIHTRNTYRTMQDQLRATLGAPASSLDRATDLGLEGTLEVPLRSITLADALSTARNHRPELLQQEHLVRAATHAVTAARSGYLPTISASVGYEWTKPSLISSRVNRLDGWLAGVQASWNIFDSQRTAGRVTAARARLNATSYAADERSLAVEVEVRQACSALNEAEELLSASAQVVTQARESLRLARVRLEAGAATQLDVLSAQSALTEARANHATARHDYAVAWASLQRTMGLAPS